MLAVTEAASARLAQMLEQESVPKEAAFRLIYQGYGVTLQSDAERPGDETFQHLKVGSSRREFFAGHRVQVDIGKNLGPFFPTGANHRPPS